MPQVCDICVDPIAISNIILFFLWSIGKKYDNWGYALGKVSGFYITMLSVVTKSRPYLHFAVRNVLFASQLPETPLKLVPICTTTRITTITIKWYLHFYLCKGIWTGQQNLWALQQSSTVRWQTSWRTGSFSCLWMWSWRWWCKVSVQ